MDEAMPSWNDTVVDVVLSDESSSSDSDMEITESFPGIQSTGNVKPKSQPIEGIGQTAKQISPEDALLRRAEMYQDYMKRIPIPTRRGSLVPFTTWTGLGRSIKQLYGQPLHYLTNAQLKQWDRLRLGSDDEDKPLDAIIHPSKAEATIWLLEEVHRRTTCDRSVAKLWLSDQTHHAFVDSIYPKLEEA